MLQKLRSTSKILMLIPISVFLYDLVYEWFVKNRFHIRTLEKWWMSISRDTYDGGREVLEVVLGRNWCDKVMQWPAPVSLAVIPVLLYVIYWICFKVKGGQSTGAYTYKSRD